MNNNQMDAALKLAKIMNYRKHAEMLDIPLLNGFEVKKSDVPSVILLATNNGIMEQLVSDGTIDESFEERIKLVISNTKDFMKKTGCQNIDDSFIYYKDYSNGVFDYKLYFCDIVKDNKVVRQINAYFIEPESRYFYEIILAAPPIDKIDVNDNITKNILQRLKVILNNIKYNDDRPIK